MAKFNHHLQQQPEEDYPILLSLIGTVGVLLCLVVTVVGIKFWWFKRSLNFDRTPSQQNEADGGKAPDEVVVTRREKTSRFSKDKRWSQQVSKNVEFQGVFKPRHEDEMELQRPRQLPPVRIRHAESEPSLILPPPRHKRRQEQHQPKTLNKAQEVDETLYRLESTAAKTMISRPTSLGLEKTNNRTSLTFEEFKNQLKLQEEEEMTTQNIAREVPQPPKRFNRSYSSLFKPVDKEEKSHRFLQSSQSIAVPEYRKVVARKTNNFHRPTEDDLTQIQDLQHPRFEKFGDRRPTGYIKFEEVDVHLSEVCRDDRKLMDIEGGNNNMYDSGYLENQNNDAQTIEAIRNEEIVYQNEKKENFNASYIEPLPLHVSKEELNVAIIDPVTILSVEYSSHSKLWESLVPSNDIITNSDAHFALFHSSAFENVDMKTKEVPTSLSPGSMEPQAFAFCYEEEEEENIYSKPLNSSQFETLHFHNNDKKLKYEDEEYEVFDIIRPPAGQEDGDIKPVSLYEHDIKDNKAKELCQITENCDTNNKNTKQFTTKEEGFLNTNHNDGHNEGFGCEHIKTNENYQSLAAFANDFTSTKEEKKKANENILDGSTSSHLFSLEPENEATLGNELEKRPIIKFEFNQFKSPDKNFALNEFQAKDVNSDMREAKDIKSDIYKEIHVQQVKMHDEFYEETQTMQIMNSHKLENCQTKNEKDTEIQLDLPIVFASTNTPPSNNNDNDMSPVSALWEQLERDILSESSILNIDEEFDKIRHSFEINEADFLEIKEELQLNSPNTDTLHFFNNDESIPSSSTGFGKSIEEDWENFEKLKTMSNDNHYNILDGHKEIQITFDAATNNSQINVVSTVSILKEKTCDQVSDKTNKLEMKPRKCKVTFDFNTEEHEIPARRSTSDEESGSDEVDFTWGEDASDDDDADDEVYNKPPPPIPKERITKSKLHDNNKNLSSVSQNPPPITLFGSQISQEDGEDAEDSWSAIRKHRHLTAQFQNLSLDSPLSPPPPSFPPPPLPIIGHSNSIKSNATPRPALRNPMTLLAIQRAKQARSDVSDFKPRSIRDSKQAQTKIKSRESLDLKNEIDDTDA